MHQKQTPVPKTEFVTDVPTVQPKFSADTKACQQICSTASWNQKDVLHVLMEAPGAYSIFQALPQGNQKEFLDFCGGQTGLYLCYDVFFKKIFDPFVYPERLEQLISVILGQPVKILEIIPNEGFHMTDRGSFVMVDVVVRLTDCSILNIEIQKNGYEFPGKRFDCYCADLIMREYNRLREKEGKHFSYRKMPPVLSIALIESSPKAFHYFPDQYIHQMQMQSDTGIQVDNLVKHIYVSLDIFQSFMQNKHIETSREAWLMLLTTRSLPRIEELIGKFPGFSKIYQEIFEFRTKPEELIQMFSKILLEGDRNMELYMIDELRKERDEAVARLNEERARMEKQRMQMDEQRMQLNEQRIQMDEELSQKDALIAELKAQLARR